MLIAASFAQVSATHESRAAPPPSCTLPFLFQMVLPVQIGCWGRGEGTAPGARPTGVRARPVAKLPLQVEKTRTSGTGSSDSAPIGETRTTILPGEDWPG